MPDSAGNFLGGWGGWSGALHHSVCSLKLLVVRGEKICFQKTAHLVVLGSVEQTPHNSFLPMLKQNSEKGRTNELFKLPKTRTEKARNDFFFRTCRLANRIEKFIEFNTKKGLKNRVLNFMWKFVN